MQAPVRRGRREEGCARRENDTQPSTEERGARYSRRGGNLAVKSYQRGRQAIRLHRGSVRSRWTWEGDGRNRGTIPTNLGELGKEQGRRGLVVSCCNGRD